MNGIYASICRVTERLRVKVKPFYDHRFFFYTVNAVVACDVLYSTYYGQKRPIQTEHNLPWMYIGIKAGLAVFYSAENLITGISLGERGLKKSPYFLLSSSITILAIAELLLAVSGWTNEVFVGVSLLRAVTLIELFKLTRWWGRIKVIIRSLFETLNGVIYLFILLFIVLCNYALLGNQFFGDQTVNTSKEMMTSGTFNTFSSSLLLTFVMLTGDNWTAIMFNTVQRQENTMNKLFTIAYFISFVVIGNFILMNVFLGIIVDSLASDFEESHDEFVDEKEKNKPRKHNKLLNHVIGAKLILSHKASPGKSDIAITGVDAVTKASNTSNLDTVDNTSKGSGRHPSDGDDPQNKSPAPTENRMVNDNNSILITKEIKS